MGKRVNFNRKSRTTFIQSSNPDPGCNICGNNEYHGIEECQAVSLARIAEVLEKIAKGNND